MRIIGGKHRGKLLASFSGEDIRPTSDRAREALFNILQFRIEGKVFYDAFCGTGAMGLEAVSRGAKTVVLTDLSNDSITLARKNLASMGEQAITIKSDAVEYLLTTNLKFDVIFLDPPYKSDVAIKALKVIAKRKLLSEDGIVIYEHKKGDDYVKPEGLILTENRKYGIAVFDFYKDKE